MCFENSKKERVRQVLPKTKNDGITLTATPSLLQLPLKGRTHLEFYTNPFYTSKFTPVSFGSSSAKT